MRRRACSLLVTAFTGPWACAGGTAGIRGLPQLPPEGDPPAIHDVHPGVLRDLMLAGELRVTPDDETLAEMTAAGTPMVEALVSVCLDADGVAITSLAGKSRHARFNEAVLAAVAGWRFRPYVRDGRAAEACSTALFRYDAATNTAEPALPPRALELPPGDLGVWAFAPDEIDVPPTPGVALAQVCRRAGRREPPDVTFMQSSGDAATDRTLLDEREVMFGEDRRAGTLCRMRSMVRRVPEPPALRELPVIERDVSPRDLEELRVSGEPDILPADAIKAQMARERRARIQVPVKLCIDRTGRVSEVETLGTSGYMPYDADLINGVAAWRFTPLRVNDTPVRACTVIQFVYRQPT